MDKWPTPFGGITCSVAFSSPEALQVVVAKFIMCEGGNHRHNFAIAVDGLTLHVSDFAVDCVRTILNTTLINTRVSYVTDDLRRSGTLPQVQAPRQCEEEPTTP